MNSRTNIKLPAWLWSRRLLTLLDVKAYLAERLVSISVHLECCNLIGYLRSEAVDDSEKSEIRQRLQAVIDESRELALPVTLKGAERLLS